MTPSPRLRPANALSHPLWWLALGVLALNDHVLKGADLLPGLVTGKLSDFAGLLVAPVLLAVVVRARSSERWLGVHLAIGAVFAGIQLFAPVADAWSHLTSLVGFRWAITMDPADCIALPMLLLSHRLFAFPRSADASVEPKAAGGDYPNALPNGN